MAQTCKVAIKKCLLGRTCCQGKTHAAYFEIAHRLAVRGGALIQPAAAEKVNITFLLTSDIYSFDADKSGRGGFARLSAVVKSERAKGGNVIYVHGGDAGKFPQVSGLAVEADLGQPPGSRVQSISIGG